MSRTVHVDPNADGGCPQCTWDQGDYGVDLVKLCPVHTKLAEQQQRIEELEEDVAELEGKLEAERQDRHGGSA